MEIDTRSELDEMINTLGGDVPQGEEEEKVPKEESSEEESEEIIDEEEEQTEEGEEEEEDLDKKDSVQKAVDDAFKDKIIEDLRREIREKEEALKRRESEEAPKEPEPLALEEHDFVGDLDLEDLMTDKKAFNKLLNAVYSKGVNDSKNVVSEGVLKTIPDIVRHNVQIVRDLQATSDRFYENNKDLKPFKRVVAAVFEEIASKNPGKEYAEILEEVGKETRKRLDLHKEAIKDKGSKRNAAPKIRSKKSRAGTLTDEPKKSDLESEIADMNKSLGGI